MGKVDSRKRLQEYVAEFERFRSLVEELPIGILAVFDRNARLLTANDALTRLLGVDSIDEIRNQPADSLFKGRCPALAEVIGQTRDTGEPVVNYTIEVDGDSPTVYLVNTTIPEDERAIVLFMNDITQTTRLERIVRVTQRYGELVGKSRAMRNLRRQIENSASYDVSVVLCGETGTGKELAARAIHRQSPRRKAPFVAVNCGALPKDLVESQLFGHVKGAYTGAVADRPGRFRRADGGTIFLDEVATLTPEIQVKLLRVLGERIVEPVGGDGPVEVDVRVIAASNQDLTELVNEGTFREDLLYRLKVVQIDIPPLRERRGDISLLTEHFIDRLNHLHDTRLLGLTPAAKTALQRHDWPGNVRELENTLEHAMVMAEGPLVDVDDLPPEVRSGERSSGGAVAGGEPERIRRALRATNGNRSAAADQLGMHRTTLWRKMREFGIDKSYGKP